MKRAISKKLISLCCGGDIWMIEKNRTFECSICGKKCDIYHTGKTEKMRGWVETLKIIENNLTPNK